MKHPHMKTLQIVNSEVQRIGAASGFRERRTEREFFPLPPSRSDEQAVLTLSRALPVCILLTGAEHTFRRHTGHTHYSP